jgi:hypothetical protein
MESPLTSAAEATGLDMKKRIQTIVKRSIGKKFYYAQKFCLAMSVPILVGLINVPLSMAQSQPEPKLSFDVVSIKPATNCGGSGSANSPGRIVLPCVRLRNLIRMAYSDLFVGGKLAPRLPDVLGGPQWIDTDTYFLQAKTEAKATIEQMYGPMLRALLEERFKLKTSAKNAALGLELNQIFQSSIQTYKL